MSNAAEAEKNSGPGQAIENVYAGLRNNKRVLSGEFRTVFAPVALKKILP